MPFRAHHLDRLRAVKLFSGCSPKQLAHIRRLATRLDVEPGRVLLQEGADAAEFYVILDGEATVSIDGAAVGQIKAGQYFGELEMIDRGPRRATISASGAMSLLVFTPAEFRALLDVIPIAYVIMRTHVAHLRVAETAIGQLESQIRSCRAERDAALVSRSVMEERTRRCVNDASHELRTPLAIVAAYAELLERGTENCRDEVSTVIEGIRAGTARLQQLVDDMLLLARLDQALPNTYERVELVSLLNAAVDAATAATPQWPMRPTLSGPIEVLGDQSQLRHAIDRLLANVSSHTPAGTSCEVRLTQEATTAVVSIIDHGPGFDAADERRVFDCFYRTDPSRSRQRGGAGLGLAVVAAIAAAHNGTVAASRTPRGGTTFTLRLPVAPTVRACANGDGSHATEELTPSNPAYPRLHGK